ncbi:MAG: orotate phosphoribosyltransferase [Microbacterium sp.]|nr:orotate phosphoribosyltransferase [Microbacterium sp.]
MTVAGTPELEADRQDLIRLIKDEAVFHGDFTLSSGKKATYYVDMRRLTLDHRAAPAIGRIMLDLISDIDGVVAVGGLTLGADPIANAVMHESVRAGNPLDAFVVRKEPKDHGRGRQIEGADVAGKRVVVVEDTSTTGQSALKAVEALRREGAEPVAVAVGSIRPFRPGDGACAAKRTSVPPGRRGGSCQANRCANQRAEE